MRIKLTDLEMRQAILGGTTLLLILVHMIAPGAGIDAVSIILLVFLALVLYGDEMTHSMARLQDQRAREPKGDSELPDRVREISFAVEHARVARNADGGSDPALVAEALERMIERADAKPRPALLLIWGALEDRLQAASGMSDGLQGAENLAERGKLPKQFVGAYEAFRGLRNEVARTADGEVTDEVLWSLIDVGAALLAFIPSSDEATAQKPGT